jgi:hypothetical protein
VLDISKKLSGLQRWVERPSNERDPFDAFS